MSEVSIESTAIKIISDVSEKTETSLTEEFSDPKTNPVVTDEKTNENESNDNKSAQPLKTSRELKSILALAKEANMETNIAYKRKSMDPALVAKVNSSPVPSLEVQSKSAETDDTDKHVKDKDDLVKVHKRKRDNSSDLCIGGVSEELIKRSRRASKSDTAMNKANKDMFCWRCHHDDVGISCETCSRSFHQKCLKQSIANPEHWPCPECVAILKEESTRTRSPFLKDMSLEHLCGLLKFAHKRMMQCSGSEPFVKPVDEKEFPDYKKYIVQPMDLIRLEKNIKDNLYGSTHAFEADAKWILHNSIIFNGFQSKLTSTAKAIIKICKQEMSEIENCPSCYLNANTKKNSWFVEVCPKPHLLLWAKLKGFPYWPAKAMRTNSSGMVDVRFFGAHDRAWIPMKECFLFSRKDPNSNKQKRSDIINCLKELEIHIENLKKKYGEFNYAPYRTPIDPQNEVKQLQMLLPNYVPDPSVTINKKKADKVTVLDHQKSNKDNVVEPSKSSDSEVLTETQSQTNNNVEKEDMEGYGTDEECDDKIDSEKRKELTKNTSIESDDDKSILQFESREDQFETQVETSILSGNNVTPKVKQKNTIGKPKSKSSDSELPSKRLSTEEFLELPHKLSRRNSDQSIKSDSSRLSSISDKISHIDISENMEITLGNEDGNVSISENISSSELSDSSKSGIFDLENKCKPIVQVNIENKEFMISPQSKLKIADRLIKKFASEESIVSKTDVNEGTEDDKKGVQDSKSSEPVIDLYENLQEEKETKTENDCDKKSKDEDAQEDTQIDEVNVRNIIHSSLNGKDSKDKKRKMSDAENVEQPFQKKLLKLVADADISKQNLSKPIKNTNEIKINEDDSITIKSEPLTDDESDSENIEAKKKYLSALNISEKISQENNKKKTETDSSSKKFKVVDNLTRVIDNVASNYSQEHDGEEITLNNKSDKLKEVQVKQLTKVTVNKSKARKSFTNVVNHNQTALKKDAKANKSEIKVSIIETYMSPSVKKPNSNNLKAISKPVTILPPNQTFTYTTNVTNPILIHQPATVNDSENESQNYIPQKNSSARLNESSSRPNENDSDHLSNLPSLVPISDTSRNENRVNEIDNELTVLGDLLPENLTRSMTEIFSRQPPKLKPRPPGMLSTNFDEGLPSSSGPVTSKINSISHRLGDYFRGMLIETLQDLGTTDNPEALIAKLKLENETLKQRHATEMSEVKKNVCSILKDMQKSISEERERIIEETRAACEAETIKRVEEAKSKQWCANCFNEAQFYCCWNTSYCDYPCQQKHWPKHMSKCIQNAGSSRNNSESQINNAKPQTPLVLRPTTAPKVLAGKKFITTKPTKVFVNRNGNVKGNINQIIKSATTGSHLTLVESTPGNYELVGNGPIAVGGKLITSTSIMGKIKSGNVITVTSPTNTKTADIPTISRQFSANTPLKTSVNVKTTSN